MKQLNKKIFCLALSVCLMVTWILASAVPVKAETAASGAEQESPEAAALSGAEQESAGAVLSSDVGLEPAEAREDAPEGYRPGNLSSVRETGLQKNVVTNYRSTNNDITWNFREGTLTVSGKGNIPDYVSGAPWSSHSYNIERLVISEGITGIGEAAFYGCYYLTDVSLPDTLTSIGTAAFANCYDLETITIPKKVTTIKDYAFQSCKLKSVTFPASLKSWSRLTFFDCKQLENIAVASGNSVYKSVDGVLFSKDGKTLYCFPAGKNVQRYSVPATVNTIGESAFVQAGVSSITIPGSVKTIKQSAFQSSAITSLSIPNSVTKIEEFICYGCRNLKSLSVGSGLKALSYRAFFECSSLVSVNLGSVTDLDYQSFAYCTSLEEIRIPKGVTLIGVGTFGECTSLKKVVFSDTVTEIAYQAFLNCTSLSSVSFPKKLKAIYRYAFYGCDALKRVTLPSSIEEVGEHAFPDSTTMERMPTNMVEMEDGSYQVVAKVKIPVKELYTQSFQVLKKVNAERKKSNLSPLKMDKELLEAAMKRAAETSIYWAHTRPNGNDCFSASKLMAGENIAAGSGNAAGVMNLWMNSPGHRANILGESYTTIGIGCVEVNGSLYWVQCFGQEGSSVITAGSCKDRSRGRTIYVNPDKQYYKPSFKLSASTIKKGGKAKVTVTWNNGFRTVSIPASSLSYKSTNTAVCTVSKGTIKPVGNGKAKIKIWFPGYEKGAVTRNVKVTGMPSSAKKTYNVKFNPNGGTKLSKTSKKVQAGKKIGQLPTVQRKGYCLKGWYTKKSGGTRVTKTTKVKKAQTLYARWSRVKKPEKVKIQQIGKTDNHGFTVSYSKLKGADGYEICYSVQKEFSKSARSKKYTASAKKTIKNLQKGKIYYVRVRAYCKDSTGKKYYGAYSSVKSVRIR